MGSVSDKRAKTKYNEALCCNVHLLIQQLNYKLNFKIHFLFGIFLNVRVLKDLRKKDCLCPRLSCAGSEDHVEMAVPSPIQ